METHAIGKPASAGAVPLKGKGHGDEHSQGMLFPLTERSRSGSMVGLIPEILLLHLLSLDSKYYYNCILTTLQISIYYRYPSY